MTETKRQGRPRKTDSVKNTNTRAKSTATNTAKPKVVEKDEVKVVEKIVEVPVERIVEKVVEVEVPRSKSTDNSELIPVRSVTTGKVVYISKRTGLEYVWGSYGDIIDIEFGELRNMRSSSPRFLEDPLLVVEDDNVANQLRLTELYNKIIEDKEIEKFLRQPSENIIQKLKDLPKGTKELISDLAVKKVKDGSLYDIRVIKVLEKHLGVELQTLVE